MIFREPLKEGHPQLQTPLHFLYQCGGIFAFISGRTEGSFLSEKVLRGRHGSVLLVVEGVSGPVDGVSDSVKPLGVVCTVCVCVLLACACGWMDVSPCAFCSRKVWVSGGLFGPEGSCFAWEVMPES